MGKYELPTCRFIAQSLDHLRGIVDARVQIAMILAYFFAFALIANSL